MSIHAAGLAHQSGYTNIKVMPAGEPGWISAGYPTYATNDFVGKENIILLDLRSTDDSTISHIPRAVSLPFAALTDRIAEIPKKAPVVLYGDDRQDTLSALKYFRDQGYQKVSLIDGGFDGWIKAEGKPVQGAAMTKIRWRRKRGKSEISRADFLKGAAGKIKDVIILDVRTDEETAAGKIKTSLHIPLNELSQRMGEIPKDNIIFIHSSQGARAEMAALKFRKHGFKAFFLTAGIACRGNECELTD